MTQKHHLSLKVYHGGGRRGKNDTMKGGEGRMSEREQQTMEEMREAVKIATEEQKQHILAFTEGMAAMARLIGQKTDEKGA